MFRMGFLNWLSDNWFTFLQSLGIIGGLFFTGIALRIDANVRRVGNFFEVTKQHREIWSQLYSCPGLTRVLDSSADVIGQPITNEEKLFVELLILHLASAYRSLRAGMIVSPDELHADVSSFFSLPIPKAIWQESKRFQDREFVKFVEGLL